MLFLPLYKSFLCYLISLSHDRDKPPTKGVLAVNTNIVRVKRPISFKFIWSPLSSGDISDQGVNNSDLVPNGTSKGDSNFSIWLPEAPKGYVALGCVVSPGRTPPPLSSAFCILASLVCPCSLRDCIAIRTSTYVKLSKSKFSVAILVLCLTFTEAMDFEW